MGVKKGIRRYTGGERFLFTLYLYYMEYSIGPDNLAMRVNSFSCHKDSKCLESNCFCLNFHIALIKFIGNSFCWFKSGVFLQADVLKMLI